jgi:tetratricopeptide (TPR) repeat protein
MRRALAAGLMMLALGGEAGCGSAPRPPSVTAAAKPRAPADKGAIPPWLPAYSAEQLALLKPIDRPIQVPARRVFPDLARFWYANNRPLTSPTEALTFGRMIEKVMTDSPRFYTLDEGPEEVANFTAQYGPDAPKEPDGFRIARRAEGSAGELVAAKVTEAARTAFDRGQALVKKGDLARAIEALRDANAKSPAVPALRTALADALARAGKVAEADAAYKAAASVDPTYAPLYLGIATLAEQRGDFSASARALAEALAYQPSSGRALELARRLGANSTRVTPFAIFLDVDSVGAIRVAAAGTAPAQMYGGCRAVLRYEPEVRAQIFDQPEETPYYLSVVEEVICLEAAIGAYIAEQVGGGDDDDDDKALREPAADPKLDALLDVARAEGLSGYVLFEILGQHRPERARLAPPEMHRLVVRYVEQHVLGQRDVPEGVYDAGRAVKGPRFSFVAGASVRVGSEEHLRAPEVKRAW